MPAHFVFTQSISGQHIALALQAWIVAAFALQPHSRHASGIFPPVAVLPFAMHIAGVTAAPP
ncbi:MAG TPA: hypothetical protein VHZ95_02435, partial [Polyangiales bacterium]|nr:hypothetical protein [Polyangiales bacterium]